MFTSQAHGLADLLSHLVGQYRLVLEDQNRRLQEAHGPRGEPAKQVDVAAEIDKLKHFVSYAHSYLAHNRPCQISHADRNYIVQLTNGTHVLISPQPLEQQQPGSLQAAGAVPVTGMGTHMTPEHARQLGMYVGDGAVAVSGTQRAPYETPEVIRVPASQQPSPTPGAHQADYTLPPVE